ncbi:eukaryotic translation initiation factor 4 gamma 3-like isoform X3 [Bolinopsis microptera]
MPVEAAEVIVAESAQTVHAEPETKEEKKEIIEADTESAIPAKIDLEEGEIVEEEETTPTGPYRYTREEMVALREAQDKILPDVPKYECIMDRPILKAEPQRPRPNNQFVPSWEQSGSRNRSRGGGDRNRSMDKNHSSMVMKGPRIIEHTLAPIQTRKKSNNAWLTKREDGTKKDPAKVPDSKLLRGNIVAILNKITPQNFKDLSVQILQLGIDNMDKLEVAVEIIFEKAVLEPAFSQTYANLCKIMGSIKFPEEQNAKVSPFRKTLLNRCQKEFFREKSDEDKINKKMDELQARTDLTENEKQAHNEELLYQRGKLKKKMLGNINFIGELFNLGMLSSKIIISQCIGNLLAKRAQGKLDDEVIECLAKLFSTVGLKLENECDDELKKRAFEKSFGDFKEVGSNSSYAYRIRFMIQDVVELRDNNWVPRRIEAKPQRIDDIHREHAKEEQQKKMEAAVAQSSRKSKSRADSRDERGRGSRDGRMDKHEYSIAPKRVNTNIDMSKLSGANQKCISQKVDSGNLILGPSRAQWGRGSGTGSGTNSPLSGSKEDLSTNNRFDMLTKKQNLVPGRTSSAPAPRKAMDRDRERASALAHAQAIGRGKGRGRTPSPSPVRSAPGKVDALSEEDIRKKTKSILTEYFDIEEIEEACACIKDELQLVKKHNIFIQEAIDIVMEAKPKSLRLLGELFPALFQEDPPLMTADGLLSGFQPAFEVAQDLAIDVPAVYANFGKLLGQTFAKGHLTFKVIKGALGPLRASDKAGLVMCEIIKNALENLDDKGSMDIQQRWGKDKMSWSDLCDDPVQLIQKYKLDFLSTTSEPKESISESDIDITVTLRNFFEDSNSSQNDVFSYIDKTVSEKAQKEGQFIKDLMNVSCTFCFEADPKAIGMYEISEDNFSKVMPILKKYLQSGKDNSDLELHALDAAQLLLHEMKHPRDLAYILFGKLEDDEIITENGFRHWRENGKEQQGHGVMRQNLKSFYLELSQDSADDSETGS